MNGGNNGGTYINIGSGNYVRLYQTNVQYAHTGSTGGGTGSTGGGGTINQTAVNSAYLNFGIIGGRAARNWGR